MSKRTKIKTYNSNFLSPRLLGVDCWRVTQRHSQRMSCLKMVRRIYWPKNITNKELYQGTGQWDITMVIMQRRWRWIGHVMRKDQASITRTALRWTPDSGRLKRSHLQETWRMIKAEMKHTGKTWKELDMTATEMEQ